MFLFSARTSFPPSGTEDPEPTVREILEPEVESSSFTAESESLCTETHAQTQNKSTDTTWKRYKNVPGRPLLGRPTAVLLTLMIGQMRPVQPKDTYYLL